MSLFTPLALGSAQMLGGTLRRMFAILKPMFGSRRHAGSKVAALVLEHSDGLLFALFKLFIDKRLEEECLDRPAH